jgi:hypothetical protein
MDRRFNSMQRNILRALCQGIAACAFWFYGLPMVQPAAPAQTSPDTQAEKTSKPKKSKKAAAADAASKEAPAPAVTGEKTPTPKKSKKSDTTSSGSANRAQTGGNEQSSAVPVRNASRTEIQSAKTGGKVWVNTDSGVYHKRGRWYGATKEGKFMTEQDAIQAGYKAA